MHSEDTLREIRALDLVLGLVSVEDSANSRDESIGEDEHGIPEKPINEEPKREIGHIIWRYNTQRNLFYPTEIFIPA